LLADQQRAADYSVFVPPEALPASVPVQLKVITGSGMPGAASDVLWVGPASLAGVTRLGDIKLAPPAKSRRDSVADADVTASFRLIDASTVWFRVSSPLFAAIVAATPGSSEHVVPMQFSAPNLAALPLFQVPLNAAAELEGEWVRVPADAIRAIEAGAMWLHVTVAGVKYAAQMTTVPNTGAPIVITMPVTVTVAYGNVYYFRDRTCIDNYVKGCEFARELVDGATISEGRAVFTRGSSVTQPAGGFYQISAGSNLPIIVGVSVGCIVLALVLVSSALYFRRRPSEWAAFRAYPTSRWRALQRTFASRV
jgi:hypothetical protein